MSGNSSLVEVHIHEFNMRSFSIVVLYSLCRCRHRISRKFDLTRVGILPGEYNEDSREEPRSDFNN